MEKIYSTNGRISRSTYAVRLAGILLGTVAASLLVGGAVGAIGVAMQSDMQSLSAALGMLIGVLASILNAFQAVKRFHDLGRSGAHYFLLWIPFYNIYAGLELLFRRGSDGTNQYGDDPVAVTRLNLGVAA